MSDPFENKPVPRAALLAGLFLMVGSIIVAGYSQLTGVGKTQIEESKVVKHIDLFFVDQPDGSVDVMSAKSGQLLQTVGRNDGGFLRVVMRGLVRDRKTRSIGPELPFRLIKREDGKVMMTDPATDISIDLDPFGASNRDAFARFLESSDSQIIVEREVNLLSGKI